MKKFLSLFFFLTFSSWVFAQESTDPTTNTQSQANAQITFDDHGTDNYYSSDLPNAVPGVSGTVLPNYFYEKGEWKFWFPAVSNLREMTREQIANMIGRSGKSKLLTKGMRKKTKGTIYKKGDCSSAINSIRLVNYPINQHAEPGDEILGKVMIEGENGWPREKYLAMAYGWSLDNNICSDRSSVLVMDLAEGVTKGRSIGLGGATATPIDSTGASAAVGGFIGTNRGRREVRPVFEVAFLNKGPLVAKVEEKQTSEQLNQVPVQNKIAPNNGASEVLLAETLKLVREQMDLLKNQLSKPQQTQQSVAQPTQSQLVAPKGLQVASQQKCESLPKFEVIFSLGKWDIKSQYIPQIKELTKWLADNPGCNTQLEGHASEEGAYDYNSALGRRRAKAVYDVMAEENAEVVKRVVVQFASVGEDKPRSAYLPDNRRVTARLVGGSSDDK